MFNWLKKTTCYKRFIEKIEDESQELSKRAAPPIISPEKSFAGRMPDESIKWVTRRFKKDSENIDP